MNKFGLIISLLSVYQLCSPAAVVPGNQAASPSPQISVLETKIDRSKSGYSPSTTELLEKLAAQLQEEEQADIESLYITLKKKSKDENIPLQIVDPEFSFRRSAEETFLQYITAIRSVVERNFLFDRDGKIDHLQLNVKCEDHLLLDGGKRVSQGEEKSLRTVLSSTPSNFMMAEQGPKAYFATVYCTGVIEQIGGKWIHVNAKSGAASRLNRDLCEGPTESLITDKSQNDLIKFNAVCELIFNDPYFANKGIRVDSQSVSAAALACRENTIKLSSGDTVSETILMFPCSYHSEVAGRGTFWIFQNPENSAFFITEEASTLSQVKFLTYIFISEIDLINVLVIIENSRQSAWISSDSAIEASAGSSDGTANNNDVVELITPILLSTGRDSKLDSEFAVVANSAAVEENVQIGTVPSDVYVTGTDLPVAVPTPVVVAADLPVPAPPPIVVAADLPVPAPLPVVAVTDLKMADSKKESDQTVIISGMSDKSNVVSLPSRKVGMTVGQRKQVAKDGVRQKAEQYLEQSAKPVQSSLQKSVQVSGQSATKQLLPSSQQQVQYVAYSGTSQDAMSILQYIIEIIRNNYEQTRQLWWNTRLYDLFTYISQSTSNSPIYSNILRIINNKSSNVSELVEYIKSLFSNKKLMLEVDEFVKKYNESSFYSRAFQKIRNWFGFDCYCDSSRSSSNNNNNNKGYGYNSNNKGYGCNHNNNNNNNNKGSISSSNYGNDNGGYYRTGGAGPTRPMHEQSKQLSLSSGSGKFADKRQSWGQRDSYQERAVSRGPLAPDGPLYSIIQKSTDCYSSVTQTVHQMLKCPGRKQPSYPYKQVADDVYSSINQLEKVGSCNKYIANYDFEEVPVVGMDTRGSTDTVISVEQTTSDIYASISQEVILVLKCAYWCDGIISIKQITDDTYDSVQQTVYVYMFCPFGTSPLVAAQRESTDVYSKVKQESKHYVYYTNDADLYGGDCTF